MAQRRSLRPAWSDLVDRCLEPSVFTEPEFLLAAARHLARAPGPAFIVVRDRAGQLVGLCPVVLAWRPPWVAARQWTHPQATEALPLLDREQASAALEALLAAVSRLPGQPAAMIWLGLPESGATAALLRTSRFAQTRLDPRTRAILAKGADPNALPAKARKELRRQTNRLSDHGPLLFRSADNPVAVAAALDLYLELEGQGWKGRRGTALGSRRETRAFALDALQDLAARADAGSTCSRRAADLRPWVWFFAAALAAFSGRPPTTSRWPGSRPASSWPCGSPNDRLLKASTGPTRVPFPGTA